LAYNRIVPTPFNDLMKCVGVALDLKVKEPFDEWLWTRQASVCDLLPPRETARALMLGLDDPDHGVQQSSLRLLLWWAHHAGDHECGRGPADWLAEWYRVIGEEIAARVSLDSLGRAVARGLHGPLLRKAAENLVILAAVHAWHDDEPRMLVFVAPVMGRALARADHPAVRRKIAEAMQHFAFTAPDPTVFAQLWSPPLSEVLHQLSTMGSITDLGKDHQAVVSDGVQCLQDLGVRDLGARLAWQ
jgi:hypothetical protein